MACLVMMPLSACGSKTGTATPNPLLAETGLPYELPDFARIEDAHFKPAFEAGIAQLRSEIAAIAADPAEPNLDNTVIALERSGAILDRVMKVFSNITNTDTNTALQELEREIYPAYSREIDAVRLNSDIFDRLKAVHASRSYLDEEDQRLVELYYRDFVRHGAALDDDSKNRIREINAGISEATTLFAQNMLAATKNFSLLVSDPERLSGLPKPLVAAAKSAAEAKGIHGWLFGLNRSVFEAFMTHSDDRKLRKRLFDGYRLRASVGAFDNGPIILRIVRLRAERAALMGYDSHAHFALDTRMAKTPERAEEFLLRIWRPGLARARREYAHMQEIVGDDYTVEGHDWWHLAEKIRLRDFALDDAQLKPYFSLEAVRQGAFGSAHALFGMTFTPVDVVSWHAGNDAFDVKNEDGDHLGLFVTDMFARDSKRGGAWMSSYRDAREIDDERVRPIITNNLNLIEPSDDNPALMSFDEVETLFHEFGHGLHGLMTTQKYSYYSGVSGPTDYTEFPAQIMEHWASQPLVLERYARHYETGEVIPPSLVQSLRRAATHNQGFKTTEFIAAALLDLRWHLLSPEEAAAITDVREFEKTVLAEYGLPDYIEPRYRSQYFSHIFAGGYSAGYYSYLWSEILDSDGFDAFLESGDIFDPALAAKLKKWVFEAGGRHEADELYRRFRGRDPDIAPLLRLRGLGGGS